MGAVLERRGKRWKPATTPYYFVFMNVAALAGAWRYFRGQQGVTWEKARRPAFSGMSGL